MTIDSRSEDRAQLFALGNKAACFAVGLVLLLLPAAVLRSLAERRTPQRPLEVVRSYLEATQARDYQEAYRFVSSADRATMDRHGYIPEQVALSGFAMQLAKQLAAGMEIQVIQRGIDDDRARFTLDYKVPATDELSSLLFNWDQNKLNALSRAERQRLIDALEKLKKARNVITSEGRETFNLVKEDGHWKIFLDWAFATPVSFEAVLPADNAIEVAFLKRRIFAAKDEPFQTNIKIRNGGPREIVARIEHRIEPREFSDDVTMVACGFLKPLILRPGEEREVSSAYLLDPGFPKNTKLSIAYQFNLETSQRAPIVGK